MGNYKKLSDKIEEFVSIYLPPSPSLPRTWKVIHDSLWGTERFERWEIAFLDTSLFQRLRFVHQTGFAYSLYPTCTHTRFDHTLGVVTMCSKSLEALLPEYHDLLNHRDIKQLRLAALFHDLGHGIFSHTSEEVYKLSDEIQDLIGPGREFDGLEAHEILSYLIVKSEPFKKFFEQVIQMQNIDVNRDEIADLIIGRVPLFSKYKSEFLNSILDADKLDYIHRDAHFSGLPLSIDLERLKHALSIKFVPLDNGKQTRKLSVLHTGVTPLEQILISRFMLYPMLYHHHKVRAGECMFKGIVEYIRENSKQGEPLGRWHVKFESSVDFLWGTDFDFFEMGMRTQDSRLHNLIHDLVYHRFLKRVLVLSQWTVDGYEELYKVLKLRDEYSPKAYAELRRIAGEICRRANQRGINVMKEQIWIDLPPNPKIGKDIEEARVHYQDQQFVQLRDIFPIAEWVELYDTYRWKGYVFCPSGIVNNIAPVAKQVLEEEFGFRIKPEAFTMCHVEPPKGA